MNAPRNWQEVLDNRLDEHLTYEVQGVAWDGQHYIFSCNANQKKPGHKDKAIYVFEAGKIFKDDNWKRRVVYDEEPIAYPVGGTKRERSSLGLSNHNGFVYVAHYWKEWDVINIVIFEEEGGNLDFKGGFSLRLRLAENNEIEFTSKYVTARGSSKEVNINPNKNNCPSISTGDISYFKAAPSLNIEENPENDLNIEFVGYEMDSIIEFKTGRVTLGPARKRIFRKAYPLFRDFKSKATLLITGYNCECDITV
jgi:hypothetical protein